MLHRNSSPRCKKQPSLDPEVIRGVSRQLLPPNSTRLMSSEGEHIAKVEKSLNQVTLLGRVGTDPQKRGSIEHPVITFSMATHTNYKYESGEFIQRTDWHRICVFKPILRDTVYTYLKKGTRVLVNGRVSYGEVKDESGNQKSTTSIIADDVIFFQRNA
ncbi:single-stranded DNA-binding protein, mitochondrial isoform X1 [Neodiprion fabricii]|uniref:single-stranded DNA-binding protein, mitochondrial isoform X1 n=1 Tax=Neodiprion fabricii TaxID=2872261 RepID=UPI001ED8FCBF|nr:single-stranded DNA-binding protein, mitochondrial isoform X1 [Neodiprion fabricii]